MGIDVDGTVSREVLRARGDAGVVQALDERHRVAGDEIGIGAERRGHR